MFSNVSLPQVENFLKTDGKKLLVYHRDADGVSSAALILKFFSGFETMPREGPIIDKRFLKNIILKKPDLIVFVDIPVDQEWEKINIIKNKLVKTKILVIDHHIYEKDLSDGNRVIHINPRFESGFEDAYLPASYVVYRLLEKMKYKVGMHIWISMTGVIGDHGVDDCQDLVKECRIKYPELIPSKDVYQSKLNDAADMICSAITLRGLKGAEKSLKLLVEKSEFSEFIKNAELKKWDKKVKLEIQRIFEDFEKKKETYPEIGLVIYQIKSRLNITSLMSTLLAVKYPDKILLVRKESRDGWKISLRCQTRKVNVGLLAKDASRNIGFGGGHKNAAGALVRDWDLFKERIFSFLK